MFGWRRRRPWWIILLAIWLIATGILQVAPRLVPESVSPYSGTMLAVLAIAAGVLSLLDR